MTTTQWRLACSNQAHVAIRDRVVPGITQAEVNSACQRNSSSPVNSLTSGGSRAERRTRFPWITPTRSTSVLLRTPIVGEFMGEVGYALLIMGSVYTRK